jgi:hypothetical protein
MSTQAPAVVSVRLTDADQALYAKVCERIASKSAVTPTTSQLYRLAMQALAEKHNVKVTR